MTKKNITHFEITFFFFCDVLWYSTHPASAYGMKKLLQRNKETLRKPFDMSCQYQESCISINTAYFISTSPDLKEILVHAMESVHGKLQAICRKIRLAKISLF